MHLLASTVSPSGILMEMAVWHHLRAHHLTSDLAEHSLTMLEATAVALWLTQHGAMPTADELDDLLDQIAEAAQHGRLEAQGSTDEAIARQARTVHAHAALLPTR